MFRALLVWLVFGLLAFVFLAWLTKRSMDESRGAAAWERYIPEDRGRGQGTDPDWTDPPAVDRPEE